MTEYLTLEDLIAAAETAVGRPAEVRDIGMLQAAAARPQATAFGEDAYRDLYAKAAALLHSIVTGRPLAAGNEALGWVAVRLFYRMNDADIGPAQDEAYDLVAAVASGDLPEVAPIAEALRRWGRPPA